jgi:hypothetical protein
MPRRTRNFSEQEAFVEARRDGEQADMENNFEE